MVLPHAGAERLVGIADLGELLLLGLDVAMHVAPGGVVLRHTPTEFSGVVLKVQISLPSFASYALTKPRMPYSPPLVPIRTLPFTTVGAMVSL